jgi:uncharacterized membrane protein
MDTLTTPVAPMTPAPAPSPAPAGNNRVLMGILSYIGVLVLIPYLMEKNDPFVKFHIKQGVVLVIIEIILWVVGSMFWGFWFILQIVHLGTIILSIIGIVNVVQNKETELPLVGSFAKSIHI